MQSEPPMSLQQQERLPVLEHDVPSTTPPSAGALGAGFGLAAHA
jgi:hypothetical protein